MAVIPAIFVMYWRVLKWVFNKKREKKKTAEVGIDTAKFCYVLLGFAAFC